MTGIPIYQSRAMAFANNGICLLLPTECTVKEEGNGMYQLTLMHPIDSDLRWAQIKPGRYIKAEVPMPESPAYEIEAFEGTEETTTTVTRKLYRVDTSGGRLRLRSKPNINSQVLGMYREGTEVIRLKDAGNGWYHVSIRKGGASGYMHSDYLRYVKDITETVTETKPVTREGITIQPSREQLFRIQSIETDTERGRITATALHVFYDLRGNMLAETCDVENADPNETAHRLFDRALNPHDFALTSRLSGTVSGRYGYKSIPEALLDPDEGIINQTGGRLLRDNFDVYLLPDAVRDMDVTIRRGKNLKSVVVEHDETDVVTRIIPVGKDDEGNDLLLEEIYIDAPNIDDYPLPLTKRIDYDVAIGDEYKTAEDVRKKLRELAQAEYDAGINLPKYGMKVDFYMLQIRESAEYPNYASLQAVHLWDTVTIIDEVVGLKSKLRVTGYEWDVLNQTYKSVTVGELQSLQQTTYGYTLDSGGITGSKIAPAAVGNTALRDASILYAKIAQATVQRLNADAIFALEGRFKDIAANSITTDALYASLADIVTLMVGDITADSITTDQLAAVLGDFVKLYADIAGIDFAAVRDLDADEAIFRVGTALELYVDRLAVTSANIVSAMLGDLVLRGRDGKYYRVVIGADGTIATEETAVTDDEITSGSTSGGQAIVGTNINVGSLNAQSIKAASATIAEIFASALTAGKITAGQALIASVTSPELYTTAIKSIGDNLELTANKSIQFLIATNDLVRAYFAFTEDGIRTQRPGSAYATLVNDVGFHIIQQSEIIASFAKRRLEVETVAVGPVNSSQPRMILTHAQDGGLLITREDWI